MNKNESTKMYPKQQTISEIETMTEAEAFAYAQGREEIKGHSVYFVDFGGHFGFSVLPFCNGRLIRWACDFELHHKGKSKEELKALYTKKMENQFFTEYELSTPLKDYFDYKARRRFICELYPLREEHLSIFRICTTKAQEEAYTEEAKAFPFFSAYAFASFKNPEIVDDIARMMKELDEKMKAAETEYNYLKSAYKYELGNHEYQINTYQGDFDTLSAFGNIEWHGQGLEARAEYYKELDFSETQIKAFEDARKEYLKEAQENDWY